MRLTHYVLDEHYFCQKCRRAGPVAIGPVREECAVAPVCWECGAVFETAPDVRMFRGETFVPIRLEDGGHACLGVLVRPR